jgi:hypothetical protein
MDDVWLGFFYRIRCKLFILRGKGNKEIENRKKYIINVQNFLKRNSKNKLLPSKVYIGDNVYQATAQYDKRGKEEYSIRITGIFDNAGNCKHFIFDAGSRRGFDDFFIEELQKEKLQNEKCPICNKETCTIYIKNEGNDFMPYEFRNNNHVLLSAYCETCGETVNEKEIRKRILKKERIKTSQEFKRIEEKKLKREKLFKNRKLKGGRQ